MMTGRVLIVRTRVEHVLQLLLGGEPISFSKLTARNTRSTVAINRWVLGYVYANSTSTSFAILRTSMSAAERLFPGKAEGKIARSLGNTETGNKRRSTVYVLGSVTTAFDVSSRSQRYRRNCGEIDEWVQASRPDTESSSNLGVTENRRKLTVFSPCLTHGVVS